MSVYPSPFWLSESFSRHSGSTSLAGDGGGGEDDMSWRRQTNESAGRSGSVCVANKARLSEPVDEKRETRGGCTQDENMVRDENKVRGPVAHPLIV